MTMALTSSLLHSPASHTTFGNIPLAPDFTIHRCLEATISRMTCVATGKCNRDLRCFSLPCPLGTYNFLLSGRFHHVMSYILQMYAIFNGRGSSDSCTNVSVLELPLPLFVHTTFFLSSTSVYSTGVCPQLRTGFVLIWGQRFYGKWTVHQTPTGTYRTHVMTIFDETIMAESRQYNNSRAIFYECNNTNI